jgi:TonB family protein
VICELLPNNGVGSIVDDRFPLLRWLGGTDRSSVYATEIEGEDSSRKAAIKLIPARDTDPEARLSQWAAAQALSHPHLVRIFDFGRCEIDGEDFLYIVTEYANEILSEILAARSLTPEETAEMLGPVLDALSWLHARDRIHTRLKPSNIMVVDEHLKLSIEWLHSDGEFGRPSLSSGKCDAPEIATGILSPATDLWPLGVVIVEALTQRPPTWDRSRGPEPLLPATIPEPFSSIVRGCLQVNPARRWTLSDVRTALEPGQTAKAARQLTPTAPRNLRGMILAGAGIVVAAAIAALVVNWTHTKTSPPAVTQTSAPTPAASPEDSAPPAAPSARAEESPAPKSPPAETSNPETPAQKPPTPESSLPTATPSQPAASEPAAAAAGSQSGSAVKGGVASQSTPEVPQSVLDTVQGHVRVRVRVEVDSQGKVTDAAIDDAGPSRYFAAKALAAARDWTFTPAQVSGQPAGSTWMLHFSFGRSGATVTPVETNP